MAGFVRVPAGLYLSWDRQVRSLRPIVRGADRLLVVGGEGHPVGDAEAGPARWDALETWTTDHFGSAKCPTDGRPTT